MAMTKEERAERKRQRDREWYEKNKERAKQRSREWREKNQERARQREREWREKNKERFLLCGCRKRAAQSKVPFDLPTNWFLAWYKETKTCFWCGNKVRLAHPDGHNAPNAKHIDRIEPARGYTKENIVIACAPCNLARAGLPEFLERTGMRLVGTPAGECRS